MAVTPIYTRRTPEDGILYNAICHQWPSLRAASKAANYGSATWIALGESPLQAATPPEVEISNGMQNFRLRSVVATVWQVCAHHPFGPAAKRNYAHGEGFSLHADRTVAPDDREDLEGLCNYLCRPAFAASLLEQLKDGTIRMSLKSVWKGGVIAVFLSAYELVIRVLAQIPCPFIAMSPARFIT